MKNKKLSIVVGFLMLLCLVVFAEELAEEESSAAQPGFSIEEVTISNITSAGASVFWLTTEATNATVRLGDDFNYSWTLASNDLELDHYFILTNLLEASSYFIEIESCDAAGECLRSGPYSFLTSQDEVIEDNLDSKASTAAGVARKEADAASQRGALSKKGSVVVTKRGIYQTYRLGKAKKLLVKPTSSRKIIAKKAELQFIDDEKIIFKLGSSVVDLRLGEEKGIDLDGDGKNGIIIKYTKRPTKTSALLFLRGTIPVITEVDIDFDYEAIFSDFEFEDEVNRMDENSAERQKAVIVSGGRNDFYTGAIVVLIALVLVVTAVVRNRRAKAKKK